MKLIFTIPGTSLKFMVDHNGRGISPEKKKFFRLKIARQLPERFIPFHACLLEKPNNSLVVSGASLSGKSLLASKLTRLDFKIQANDFVVVWEEKNKIFGADLNLSDINQNKKPVMIDKLVFLVPDDPRDCFKLTPERYKDCYQETLRPLSTKLISCFSSKPVFKKVYKSHFALGNRTFPDRWVKGLNRLLNEKKLRKIGLIGVGTIGEEISSLLMGKNWLVQMNLYSPNQKKLFCQILDLKSANTKVDVVQCRSPLAVIKKSDLVIFCFRGRSPKIIEGGGERMGKLSINARIIWKLSRYLRKENYSGKILVVTNPVDILSWATYYFSNLDHNFKLDWKGLDSSQVIGMGLGLDYTRLKRLTSLPLELIGEHGENVLIAKRRGKRLVKTKQEKVLNLVKTYSPRIREFVERTKVGPAHEVLRIVNSLENGEGILRVSSLDEKSVFLGNVFDYQDSLLVPCYHLSSRLETALDRVRLIHRSYQKVVLKEIRGKRKMRG